jgi:NTE family protein
VQERFDVKSVKDITERSLLLAISVNSTESKAKCNIVVEPPELSKFGTFDLARGREIFDIGYKYTRHNFKAEDFQLNKDVSFNKD